MKSESADQSQITLLDRVPDRCTIAHIRQSEGAHHVPVDGAPIPALGQSKHAACA